MNEKQPGFQRTVVNTVGPSAADTLALATQRGQLQKPIPAIPIPEHGHIHLKPPSSVKKPVEEKPRSYFVHISKKERKGKTPEELRALRESKA